MDPDILAHRQRYGIREATSEELALMTDEQRWHYQAAALKPHGLHFEHFRHEGRPVRPIFLTSPGNIGWGSTLGNEACLRALPPA